jgi:hypothetical protein
VLWEFVYRAPAQKRPWYIRSSCGRYIATVIWYLLLKVKYKKNMTWKFNTSLHIQIARWKIVNNPCSILTKSTVWPKMLCCSETIPPQPDVWRSPSHNGRLPRTRFKILTNSAVPWNYMVSFIKTVTSANIPWTRRGYCFSCSDLLLQTQRSNARPCYAHRKVAHLTSTFSETQKTKITVLACDSASPISQKLARWPCPGPNHSSPLSPLPLSSNCVFKITALWNVRKCDTSY